MNENSSGFEQEKIQTHTRGTMDERTNPTPTKIVNDHYIEVDSFNWWQPYYNAHIPISPKRITPTTTNMKVLVYHCVAPKIPQSNSSSHMNGKQRNNCIISAQGDSNNTNIRKNPFIMKRKWTLWAFIGTDEHQW